MVVNGTRRVSLVCDKCGNAFDRTRSQVQDKNYCCWDCFIDTRKASDKSYTKICGTCGTEFTRKHDKGQQYCSVQCGAEARSTYEMKSCKECGEQFKATVNRKKFCSRECKHKFDRKRQPRIAVNCESCGTIAHKHPHQIKQAEEKGGLLFCSHACRMRHYASGKNNSRWKGGVSPLRKRIRELAEYKAWVLSVFQRDEHTCQLCGERGGCLDAHHAIPFAVLLNSLLSMCGMTVGEDDDEIIEAARSYGPLWNQRNGITLCRSCHGSVHGTNGK